MAHAGWKWRFGSVAFSAAFLASSLAAAQPQDAKTVPKLVLPKIDVRAAADAPKPLTVINSATAATVAKIVDAMHRQEVVAATVLAPATSRPVAVVATKERARPVKLAPVVIEAKPAPIVQPQTGIDSHGLVGQVPGIQIRMPWRIP